MAEIKLTAKIDTTEIDEAIKKAHSLRELLKEANSLANELAPHLEVVLQPRFVPCDSNREYDENSRTKKEINRI